MTTTTSISRSHWTTARRWWRDTASRPKAKFAAAVALDAFIVYALWQLLIATGVLPRRFFPSANEMLTRVGEFLTLPAFWAVVGDTLQAWALGLALGVVTGSLVGIALGSSIRAYRFCRIVIEVMRPIPPVVLIPIALLVLGPTLKMQVVLIIQGTVWLVILQAVYGVRAVDPVALETGRSYGLSRARRFVSIQVPGSLPFIATGVRLASIVALIVAIVAELVGGASGLGNAILKAQANGDAVTMYALIFVTGCLGIVITAVFTGLERLVLFWHPSHRKGAAGA